MFNMDVDVIRLAHNFEPKYRVTYLTKEEWTKRTWNSSCSYGARLVYISVQDTEGNRGRNLWAIFGKKGQHLLRKNATVFQAEIYAILAYA
jgi:hypothetical protein